MPVDNTRVVSSRRTQKQLTEEELKDIDRKRLLGELSCAECRRLKLRCDKKLPCGSCFRRGCESICPLGILAAGQGTRFILADTEQLHGKIYEMSNRIRQLEDSLAILQSTVSDKRHPLLTDELLKIKFGSEAISARLGGTSDVDTATNNSIDALGTLTLGSSGEMQYFGSSAGSERAGEEADASDEEKDGTNSPPDIFPEVYNLANLFPFTNKSRPTMHGMELIETSLPSFERASQLCDSYIKHGAYFFRPIKSDDLMDSLFPSIYNKVAPQAQSALGSRPNDDEHARAPHALATLCFIFALGCLLDLTAPPYNSEAERYYDLGRAALSLRPIYDSPSIDAVQAMGLMATYHTLAGKKYTRDSAWCLMSFAAKLAQSIGLHRDSARWHMDPKTVQRRRNLFWEVFSADVSHSLALGRPPAIHLSYVDCEFPMDEDASLSNDAEYQTGFWRMKHRFARDIYNSVADATLIARSPSYSTILDLDRRIREISFPASFNPYVTKDVGPEIFHSSSLSLRDFYASQHRTVTMIYLHRSFFAQAVLDHPTNPLLSPFAPSFLTAYRCSSIIIKASAHLFERCAAMAMRLWFLMYHTFSAAVIVGTVVTRSPNSNIASIAMRDFSLAVSLFERSALQSPRARIALGVLLKLRDKANRAFEQFSGSGAESSTPTYNPTDDMEDELAIFGGQMRVLDRKGKNPQKLPSTSGAASASSPQTSSSASGSPVPNPAIFGLGLNLPDVHPSLITYLNQDAVRRALDVSARNVPAAPVSTSVSETGFSVPGSSSQSAGRYHPSDSTNQPASRMDTSQDVGEAPASLTRANRSTSNYAAHNQPMTQPYPAVSEHSSRDDWNGFDTLKFTDNTSYPRSGSGNPVHDSSPSRVRPTHSRASSISMSQNTSIEGAYPHFLASNPGLFSSQVQPPQYHERLGHFGVYNYSSNPGAHYDNGLGGNPPVEVPNPQLAGWMGDIGGPMMNVAGAVEMGLSSESGMDAGWMSFMRDCGIMDTEG